MVLESCAFDHLADSESFQGIEQPADRKGFEVSSHAHQADQHDCACVERVDWRTYTRSMGTRRTRRST